MLSYDNSLKATLVTIKLMSLDGWRTELEYTQDGASNLSWPFFWVITLFFMTFAVNLMLAILAEEYSNVANQEREEPKPDNSMLTKILNRIQDFALGSSRRGPQPAFCFPGRCSV